MTSENLHPIESSVLQRRRERVFLVLAGLFLGSMAMLNILGVTRFLDLSFTLFGRTIPVPLAVGVLPYPISDELWARIEPILWEDAPPPPAEKGGRKRTDWRRAFNGIIYRMRTGCQWNHLPKEFGDDSSVHRWFQRWNKNGVMAKVWASLASECAELGAVEWEWQSADGAMGKARFGGDEVGPNPTDRGKNGTKRSLIVDEDGGPLGAVIAGANVHDTKLLAETIAAIVVERPEPTAEKPQNLCLDKGYDNPTGREAAAAKGHTPHVRRIGEEKAVKRGKKNTSRDAG